MTLNKINPTWLAVIISASVLACGVIVFASTLQSNIERNTERIERIDTEVQRKVDRELIETELRHISLTLNRLEEAIKDGKK